MKINSKIISEKVDYYIDLMLECECKEPEENEIPTGEEPKEGEKQKDEIIDDIMEEDMEVLHDEDDDIDNEKDLDSKDGKKEDEVKIESYLASLLKVKKK